MSSITPTLMILLAVLNVAVLALFALVELRERWGRRSSVDQRPARTVAPEAQPEPDVARPAEAAGPVVPADPALPDLLAELIQGVELEETKSRGGSGRRWKTYLEVGGNLPAAAGSRRPGAAPGH